MHEHLLAITGWWYYVAADLHEYCGETGADPDTLASSAAEIFVKEFVAGANQEIHRKSR
jgi:hypothetical protein